MKEDTQASPLFSNKKRISGNTIGPFERKAVRVKIR